MRQCGVIQVDTFEQMMDAVMLATSYNVPTGPRIGFLVAGGGTAVLFTDLAYGNGMEMPPLLKTTQERIFAETGIKSVNTFTSNPVDLGASGIDFKVMAKALSVMDDDPGIDILVPYFSIDFIDSFLSEQIECGPRLLVETAKTLKKPIIPILSKFTEDNLKKEDTRINIASVFREAGMPVFNNMQDYIHALRKVLGWSAKFTPRR
jgi:acetyl-CoA synthetase (ADP-forming)/acetyltransferase